MTVVNIGTRTTNDQRSFDDYSYSDKSLLWLSRPAAASPFSLDLTVGDTWSEKYGPDSNAMLRISDDGILLARHGSIVVQAAEEMKVPHNLYGILVPTGSLFLDKGILIAPAKVEPSFTGHLKLRLFNTTSFRHRLKKGDKLGSVIFFGTETTRFQPAVTKRAVVVDAKIPLRSRLWRWSKANTSQIVSWLVTLIGGSMMAALMVHFVLTRYFPNPTAAPAANTPPQRR